MVLISTHIPKTAGVSFKKALYQYFGQNEVFTDYLEAYEHYGPRRRHRLVLNRATRILAREKIGKDPLKKRKKCIHGHFMPFKYLPLKDIEDTLFITWLRNPVDRVVSHYNYWKRVSSKETYYKFTNHKKMQNEKWSLEKFCLHPIMKNLCSEYLWGFPLRCFDFIGVMEHYREDLKYFANTFLNCELPYEYCNETQNASSVNSKLIAKIKKYHSKDIDLYKRVLELRQRRVESAV